jgi:hypothetical protein
MLAQVLSINTFAASADKVASMKTEIARLGLAKQFIPPGNNSGRRKIMLLGSAIRFTTTTPT